MSIPEKKALRQSQPEAQIAFLTWMITEKEPSPLYNIEPAERNYEPVVHSIRTQDINLPELIVDAKNWVEAVGSMNGSLSTMWAAWREYLFSANGIALSPDPILIEAQLSYGHSAGVEYHTAQIGNTISLLRNTDLFPGGLSVADIVLFQGLPDIEHVIGPAIHRWEEMKAPIITTIGRNRQLIRRWEQISPPTLIYSGMNVKRNGALNTGAYYTKMLFDTVAAIMAHSEACMRIPYQTADIHSIRITQNTKTSSTGPFMEVGNKRTGRMYTSSELAGGYHYGENNVYSQYKENITQLTTQQIIEMQRNSDAYHLMAMIAASNANKSTVIEDRTLFQIASDAQARAEKAFLQDLPSLVNAARDLGLAHYERIAGLLKNINRNLTPEEKNRLLKFTMDITNTWVMAALIGFDQNIRIPIGMFIKHDRPYGLISENSGP